MEFWKDCPDDVLIAIFKNFDLETRLKANQVCRRWYELLKDPRARMEDVSCITLTTSEKDMKRWRKKLWENSIKSAIENLMEGLSNHIGKAEELHFREKDENIVSLISEMIDDGLLKINKLVHFHLAGHLDENTSITNWVNAILPSSIRELRLFLSADQQQLLECDWSLLPQLQRLTLSNILVDFSVKSPSLLKYLELSFHPISTQAAVLNTVLSFLPMLEELGVSRFIFDDQSFRDFLFTIKNKLPNFSCLRFYFVEFSLRNIDSVIKEFKYDFVLETLKEIRFENCVQFQNIIRLFLRICSLDILYIGMFPVDFNHYFRFYDMTSSISGNTKLELRLSFDAIETPYRCASDCLPQFCPALTKLEVFAMNSRYYLRNWFINNSYEKLTQIELDECDGLNDDNLKIIAKSCLWLEKFRIDGNKKITKNGLKSFFIYWRERRSKQLSIVITRLDWSDYDLVFQIDGLFGTSLKKGRGILEKHWMMDEDENGRPSKRRKKSMEEIELCWMLYRKRLPFQNVDAQKGTRLVIWDQEKNLLGDSDQKILVIKNYEKCHFYRSYVKTMSF